jgi:hypothetical protein
MRLFEYSTTFQQMCADALLYMILRAVLGRIIKVKKRHTFIMVSRRRVRAREAFLALSDSWWTASRPACNVMNQQVKQKSESCIEGLVRSQRAFTHHGDRLMTHLDGLASSGDGRGINASALHGGNNLCKHVSVKSSGESEILMSISRAAEGFANKKLMMLTKINHDNVQSSLVQSSQVPAAQSCR